MKKINLLKFGFVRSEADDFSDDGNKFYCYRIPGNDKIRISKLVSHGDAYISAHLEDKYSLLSYEEYSKLNSYLGLDKLNGVSVDSITDSDLNDLYRACIDFTKEYEDRVKLIDFPDTEEYEKYRKQIKETRCAEYKAALTEFADKATTFVLKARSYDFSEIQRYLEYLRTATLDEPLVAPIDITKMSSYQRISFQTKKDLQPSWYYTEALKVIEEVCKK